MKAIALLALCLILTCSIKTTQPVHQADAPVWEQIDVKNLNDDQKSVDDTIRNKFGGLSGDLFGAAKIKGSNTYRYYYKDGDNVNWDVQVSRNQDKGQNQILRATKTENSKDSSNENLLITKKTSIIKKNLADVVKTGL